MKSNILHFLRSYGFHGGEKQIYKIISKKLDIYDHFFLDINKNKKLRKKFKNIDKKYNNLLPFDFININIYLELFCIFLLYPFLITKLIIFIKKNNINLIFAHNFQAALIVIPVKFIFFKRIKLVYFHRIFKKNRKYDFFSSKIYSIFDTISCNSNAVKKSLEKYTNKKIIVVNNYVEENASKYNFKNFNEEIILISVSRLEKRKNIKFLINVFDRMSKNHKNIYLHIIGNGTQESKLKKYTKNLQNNKIKFFGRVDDVIEKLKESSIYLCASELEGMSNSLLEAMSVGLPTVIVKSHSVSDCHIENVTALFSNKTEIDFQNNCEKLINDKKLRNKLSLQSINHVQENYSFDKTMKAYIEIYKNLLT